MESYIYVDENQLKREREKARELRDSAWWKRKRSSGICYYCGRKFPPASLTMDHIIPLGKGGKSVKENLVPCCKECNNKKKNLLPIEWVEYLEELRKKGVDSGESNTTGNAATDTEEEGDR